jgi:hypothetical protein
MELALLIYGVSLLPQLSASLGWLLFVLVIPMIISGITWLVNTDDRYLSESEKERAKTTVDSARTWFKRSVIWFFIAGAMNTLLPSEKTAYMMVGGYVSQTIVQSDAMGRVVSESSKISGKILDIINNKLDGYVEETVKGAEKAITNDNTATKP